MCKLYISKNADSRLVTYLSQLGYKINLISTKGIVADGISDHPDIFMCKLGVGDKAPIVFADTDALGAEYPEDIPFNAACTGKYFIHNLDYTDNKLLLAAKSMSMELIHVKQGYAKCSIVIVDENAIITYDRGIADACAQHRDLHVLEVSPGFVHLKGYNSGFIGGCCGRVGRELIFNGDLSKHPDFRKIVKFVRSRNVDCRWFEGYPLTDIGSII